MGYLKLLRYENYEGRLIEVCAACDHMNLFHDNGPCRYATDYVFGTIRCGCEHFQPPGTNSIWISEDSKMSRNTLNADHVAKRLAEIGERRAAVKNTWAAEEISDKGPWAVLGSDFDLPPFGHVPITTKKVAEFIALAPDDIDYLLGITRARRATPADVAERARRAADKIDASLVSLKEYSYSLGISAMADIIAAEFQD